MKKLVIFGCGELAHLAHEYFTKDSSRQVTGFVVDDSHFQNDSFLDLPVIAFSQVSASYPPENFDIFVAVGYSGLNQVREQKFLAFEALGYDFASYVSSSSHVWQGTKIGRNCFIMEGNTIQPFVEIADNVVIWSGSLLSHGVTVGDSAFISSQVVISGGVQIGKRSFLGVNSTIREHIRIGEDCLVGAGAMILKDTDDGSAYLVEGTTDSGIPSRRLKALL